jgi:acetyl esterase
MEQRPNYRNKYLKYSQQYKNLRNGSILNGGTSESNPPILDYVTDQFMTTLIGSTPTSHLLPDQARDVLNKVQSDTSYLNIVDIESFTIDVDDIKTQIKIFRPKNNKNTLPVIFYVHGGGWILGSAQTHGRLVSEFATKISAAIVFIEYALAPEKKYPTQLNQCMQSIEHVIKNYIKYNLDISKIIIAGDSVGGGMATVLVSQIIEQNKFKIAYQVLMYPVTEAKMNTQSYEKFKDGPWLTLESMKWFFDAYEPDIKKRENPNISPLNTDFKVLAKMPPTLIVFGENDVLCNDAELYAQKLMKVSIQVTAMKVLGTIHDFLMLDPLKDSPPVIGALTLIIGKIKEVLYGK